MARFDDRRKATELRLAGQTYSYIRAKLNVNKSTLSDWLKNIKLTECQVASIKKNSIERRVETYIAVTRLRRQRISEKFYKSGYNWVDIAKANNIANPNSIFIKRF